MLDDLVRAVVRAEVRAFGRGVLRSLALHGSELDRGLRHSEQKGVPRGEDNAAVESLIKLLLEDPSATDGSLVDAVASFSQQSGQIAEECSAVLGYYALVEDLFLHGRSLVEAAIAETPDDSAAGLIGDLAAVRAMLPVSSRLAMERLVQLRDNAGLVMINPTATV
jgi:hypothetical protein